MGQRKVFYHQHLDFLNCLPAAATAKSLQSCPTLCNPIDSSPTGSPSLGFSRQEHWSGLPFPSPCLFVFILSYMSCLYFGSESVVSHIICKCFLPVGRLSFLFMVFFAVQKLVSLIRFHLFSFAFVCMLYPLW